MKRLNRKTKNNAAKAPRWLRDIAASKVPRWKARQSKQRLKGTFGPASPVRHIDPKEFSP